MKHPPFKYALSDFSIGIENMMRNPELRSVTVFCAPLKDVKNRVRITRRGNDSLIVTYGKPNYGEREFLKTCRKAKCLPRRLRFQFFKKK